MKLLNFLKNKTGMLLLLLITMAGVLKFQSNKYHDWADKECLDRSLVRSDGAGYYAYLPQHFIYHDPTFLFIDSILVHYPGAKLDQFGNYILPDPGRMNKFFPGVAICQLPFFLSAHIFHSANYESDGYSYPYQKAIALGGICFLLLGIFLSYLVMMRLKIAPLAAALSLIGISLGTPLLFYTINEPLASHVYSFGIIALFVYLLLIWKDSRNSKWLPFIGLTLGLVVLLRPVNGIVVIVYFALFPTLREAWKFLVNHLFHSFSKVILVLACFASVVFLQFLNVYYQTGNLAFNLYSTETFENWNKPPIWNVLFGYRKGLFIYAPLTLFAFLGLAFALKKYRIPSLMTFLFFLIFTYITSSWWCWWYGGSIGMRPMVDISLLYAIGVGIVLDRANWIIKLLTLPVLVFCIFYQFILSYQFENGILHYDQMNKERFDFIFLKTDPRLKWKYFIDTPAKFGESIAISKTLSWNDATKSFTEKGKNGKFEIEHMVTKELYAIDIDSSSIDQTIGIRIEGDITIRDKNNTPMIIILLKQGDVRTQAQTDFIGMRIQNICESSPIVSDYVFPDAISKYDRIVVQISNSHGRTTIENLKIQIIEK
jgi:hypothetical protein